MVNNMNIVTEELKLNRNIASSKVQKLVEGDIIVPDIKPDILKLLQTDALTFITDKHINDGCAEVKGKVDLTMLYIPDSEADRVRSINACFDFEENIVNRELSSTDSVILNSYVERVEVNVVNSRKLKIKVVVAIEYEFIKREPLLLAVDTEDGEDVQIKRETVSVQNSIGITESVFDIHEKAEIASGQESIAEILKYDIKIADCEHKPMGEKVILKGTLCVCVLYISNSGNIEFSESEIPFTEIVEIENLSESSYCDVDLSIGECRVSPEEDTDGDIRIIDIECSINSCIKAVEDMEVDMISDCYEPYKSTSVERKNIVIDEIISRPQTQNTIRDIIEVGSDMPQVTGVYDVLAHPCMINASINGGRVVCEGKIEAYVLCICDSSQSPVCSIKKEIPFSYMIDDCTNSETLTPKVKAQIKHIGYSLNAAGEIELRLVLSLNANIIKQRSIDIISNVYESENNAKECNGIVIYFVQQNDTLWNIGKKYCVPTQSIVDFNSIKEETLKEGTRLLIPGR